MKKLKLFTLLLLGTTFLQAQNQAPQISNLSLSITGDHTLNITYDVVDAENDDVIVSFQISDDGGKTYRFNTENATGDVNVLQATGTNKSITWEYGGALSISGEHQIRLTANDLQPVDIQSIVDQVDSNLLRSDLDFVEGPRHRSNAPVHLQEVRDFIQERFTNHGFGVSTQTVLANNGGINFIGSQVGTGASDEVYILDAHYDSVPNTPGADDNGSGIVGMLEAARILASYNFNKTIRYIGFDLEEIGLVGARKYVAEGISADDDIKGVLNLEMIGYYTEEPNTQAFPQGFNFLYPDEYGAIEADEFRGNFIANIGIVDQNDWEQAYAQAANTYVPELKVVTFNAPSNWQSVAPDLGRSDHAEFWRAGIPAVMITNTSEFRTPHYHQPSDNLETLNFTFMSQVVKAAVATLATVAEIQHSTSVSESINIMVTGLTDFYPCAFQIYPNPVQDALHLSLPECEEDFSYFQVYDIQGKLLVDRSILKGKNDYSINTKNWESGLYILKTNKGLQRFLKQ